jgi:NAD(P)-dependent dehydrogenase (short-subunit alcohol dehydrogenase family)
MLTQAFAEQAPRAVSDVNGEPVAQAVVVNIIDQRVLKPTPFFTSYLLAKSGLMAFTRSAAQALAPHIRVGGIGPGPTLVATNQSDEHFAQQRKACILGRGSDPEDIVSAMRFIISNKAFTGQMLAIDGGQHLIWQTPDVQGMVE